MSVERANVRANQVLPAFRAPTAFTPVDNGFTNLHLTPRGSNVTAAKENMMATAKAVQGVAYKLLEAATKNESIPQEFAAELEHMANVLITEGALLSHIEPSSALKDGEESLSTRSTEVGEKPRGQPSRHSSKAPSIADSTHSMASPKRVRRSLTADQIQKLAISGGTAGVESANVQGSQRSHIVLPDSPFRYRWSLLMLLLTLYCALAYPYVMAFDIEPPTAYIVWDMLMNISFISDIYITSISAYKVDKDLILDPKVIRDAYFKSAAFPLDVAACIPIELVDIVVVSQGMEIPPWLRVLRLLRLLRISKLKKSMMTFLNDISDGYVAWFQLYVIMFYIVLITHYIGCGWYLIGLYENFPPNFYLGDDDTTTPTEENPVPLTRLEAFKEKSKPEQYACAAAWALTAVTGMGLDLKPITVIENLYTIMVVAIGMMLYATVIAQVSGILDSKNRTAREFEETVGATKRYLIKKGLPPDVVKSVEQYFEEHWHVTNGVDETRLLGRLSEPLANRVNWHLRLRHINRIPCLNHLSEVEMGNLAREMTTMICVPSDVIVPDNDANLSVHFIYEGKVVIAFSDMAQQEEDMDFYEKTKGEVSMDLSSGDWFGAQSVFVPEGEEHEYGLRKYSAVCVEASELFVVPCDEIWHLCQENTVLQDVMLNTMKSRHFG